ncbi:MAG TPA: CPBP family intramembrane glutamic endopeptidase [Thermoleophilaceae bacterium]|nr:CPBP family intramembrane glutamic endopeptidase [Thermoleophilaceae bacterium]
MAARLTATPTPIPDAHAYSLAIVVVYGLSTFSLTAQAYSRWLTSRRISFPFVYCVVLAVVVAYGVSVVGVDAFGSAPSAVWVVGAATGLAGGLGAKRFDQLILRTLERRHAASGQHVRGTARGRVADRYPRTETVGLDQAVAPRRRPSGVWRIQRKRRAVLAGWSWGFASSSVVAALEEMLHRGVLLETARLLPGQLLFATACAGLVLVFALTHIWFGLRQVAAKLPLGVVALVLVLIYGTIVPAVVAHVVFNLMTVAEARGHRQ